MVYRIEAIPRITADEFLAKFEILGDVGLGVWHWGLFYREDLLSVVTFGNSCFGGKRGWIAQLAHNNKARVIQLCRGGTVPNAPIGTGSRIIAMACRAMRGVLGPFVAVAYANEDLGEVGTIYQAAGAVYTGKTDPKGQANYFIDGKWRSAWLVRKHYGTRDRKRLSHFDSNMRVELLKPKHRYVLISAPPVQKTKLLKALSSKSQPYPRRPTRFP